MGSVDERWSYNVNLSLIGWAHAQNDPETECNTAWNSSHFFPQYFIHSANATVYKNLVWYALIVLKSVRDTWDLFRDVSS